MCNFVILERGKKHFPSLHNHQSSSAGAKSQGTRRYLPHGYGLDYNFRPHVQHVQPEYSEYV